MRPASPSPRHERELAPAVRAFLEPRGYRVWVDPDGTDDFDIVARRDREIGLVELKIADGPKVLGQALRRRAWADWVALAVPRESLARRILARPVAERGERVGVWWVGSGTLRELRAPRPLVAPGEPDPFAARRREMGERLDLLESGALPGGVAWNLRSGSRRSLAGRRGTSEWRLEEFGEGIGPAAPLDAQPSDGARKRSNSSAIRP